MKPLIILSCALFLFALTASAQTNKADMAVNRANNAVNSANASVNNASATATNAVGSVTNTANQVKDVANQVGSLFGKKHPANVTIIKVPGATLGKLKTIYAGLKDCGSVDASSLKLVCTDDDQSITVNHKGSTSDLLEQLEKKTQLVNDDNVRLSEGNITVKL